MTSPKPRREQSPQARRAACRAGRRGRSLPSTIGVAALAGLLLGGCDGSEAPKSAASAPNSTTPAGTPEQTEAEFSRRLAEVLAEPDPYQRARRLGALLPELGPEVVPEIRRTLNAFPMELGAVEYELLTRFWAAYDPEAATTWAFDRSSPPTFRTVAARIAIEAWAEKDPASALAAADEALTMAVDQELARVIQVGLVRGWFRSDRAGLERYIYDLGHGTRRQRALFAYTLTIAASEGSEALIRWAESAPEDDERFKLNIYRQTMSALSIRDMDAAVRFCDHHCGGPYGSRLRLILARTRIRNGEDGGKVVEWIGRGLVLSEDDDVEELPLLFGFWALRDRGGALAWMKEQIRSDAPPAWLPHLYAEYARQLGPEDPVEAIRWAEQVEGETDRERILIRIVRSWLKQDEEAAEAWLDRSSLSEAARRRALDLSAPTYLPLIQSEDS